MKARSKWEAGWHLAFLGFCAAWLLSGCSRQERTEPLTGDPTMEVASVGGEVITLGEVTRLVEQVYKAGRKPDVDPNLPILELQKRAVDDLISQRLVYLAAKEAGTLPTDTEVADAFGQFWQGRYPDEAAFVAELGRMNLTKDEFLRDYQRSTGINRFLQQAVEDTVEVTPEQARVYYDEHPDEFHHDELMRARHILVRVDPGATPEQSTAAEARIRELESRARRGEDFAQLAERNSQDPGSAVSGGDLGFFRKGQMVAPFDSVAFSLEPGEISGPVRTQFGWHLIQAQEKVPAGPYAYEEIADRLQALLRQKRAQERVQAYVEELRQGSKIKRII